MKKQLISIIFMALMISLSMCINTKDINGDTGKYIGNLDNKNYINNSNNNTIYLNISGNIVELPLRASVKEALSTELINTSDSDILRHYLTTKIIYFEYNKSLPSEEGMVSITDLSMKLGFLNSIYPHEIVDDSVFNNESEIERVKNSNITMIIKIIRSNSTAKIVRVNRTFVIEGNSLKELDKAETRFVLAIYTGLAK
ncbi:MAG TPA: hypothetical protein EYG76_01205 [Methanothermococcus okinawensis]|uniref:Uncharacterized protein n=1 Tax=Methanothermococcus okinawensis TaxID=155863 RepID=A0A832YRI8_9EURY|nr:hypothetical protein [Methanothermococcus okinawensis]